MCAARLEYNPNSRGLQCPFCGYDKKIDRGTPEDVPERDYLDYLEREDAAGEAMPGRAQEVHCTGCGANVLLEDKVATQRCPFCLTHLENATAESTHAMLPPESLLPFLVELRQAREAFNDWIKTLWFAPNSLKQLANLGQLNGLYIPFWTYDAMTVTFYRGLRGDNYTDFVYYTDSNGNRQTRPIIRTRWTPVSGEVRHFLDDVLICSSESVPSDLLNRIADWPLKKLEPFRPEFLSGFKTERYALNLQAGYLTSKDAMKPLIHELVRRDIGGDIQQVQDESSKFSAITFKPLLLPIWIAVYRYHEQTYQIIINGTNAKVAGYRPFSSWKIAGAVVLGLALLAVIVWVVVRTNPS